MRPCSPRSKAKGVRGSASRPLSGVRATCSWRQAGSGSLTRRTRIRCCSVSRIARCSRSWIFFARTAATREGCCGGRHARACPGHPRLDIVAARKTWMAGTSPAMTSRWTIETMKHQSSLRVVFSAIACLSSFSASHAQKADPAAVAEHIAAATAAAKSDLLGPLTLCQTATPAPGPSFMDNYRAMVKEPPLAPMQVMDELYFLGSRWTTAWAIKTAGGLIIVDTMDNADEAEHYIEGGLRKLGLDPAEIRYVVISHGHGDHYGGAAYLQQKFNPRIVMSEIDWNALEETQRDPLFGTKRNPLFGEPPKRDMAVADGDTIQLAGTALKFHVIPGHTLGTLATMFTVHDRGEPHRAVAWGGTAYNFGPLPDRLQLYSDTTI